MFQLCGHVRTFSRQISKISLASTIFRTPRWISTLNTPEAFRLRPYQESCLQACFDALTSGATRIGVSLPTGSGKTTVFVTLVQHLKPPADHPNARKALIIVNSVELARQSAEQVRRLFPDLSVEIEQGTKHKASGFADVTIATYQTLLRGDRLQKFNPNLLKCVVVDEAHHAAAPSYRKILSHFDPEIRSPDVDFPLPKITHPIPIVGFSATFSRHDGLALGSVFERIVYHRDFLEMIKEQWLCNVRFTSVKAKLKLSDVTINTRTGEFNPTSLAHVINTESINNLVVQSWLDKASHRRSTLVFCVNLAHLRELTDTFRKAGVDARYVFAGTPAVERKVIIDAFRSGEFPVLLNVAILTEGADIPNIDCVIVARPTRSRNVFAQMIGRGMRLSAQTGKDDCHIIDFVDSTTRVTGIVSTPTLFGLDPDDAIEDVSLGDLENRAEQSMEGLVRKGYDNDDVPEPTSVTYIDYDNPFSLVQDTSGAPHISKLSRFAWVGCGDDIYVLECLGKGFIRIEPQADESGESHFVAHYSAVVTEFSQFSKSMKMRFSRPRSILTARSLDEAVRGCDTYAVSKVVYGNMSLGMLRTAKWRKEPATEGQKLIVSKRLSANKDGLEDGFSGVDKLTKGQAANIITRLKHGAQMRYSKKIKLAAKEAQAASKESRRKAREHVSVGPLPVDGLGIETIASPE